MAMNEQERELWQRARDGDRAAIDQLLRQHERNVYRFGLRMCGDEEAAKEVLQETLLAAFQQLGSFRGDARISTWLYSIARSFCSRYHRRGRSVDVREAASRPDEHADEIEAGSPTPHESTEQAQMAELVATAIGLLPEHYREVVVLRDVEGLTADEAAGILSLEIPALKSRLHRGRQMLKQHLAAMLRERGGALGERAPCPQLAEDLSHLHGQDIDQAACVAIERHLETCSGCREALGDLQQAAALCRRLPGNVVPMPVQRAVRMALAEALNLS